MVEINEKVAYIEFDQFQVIAEVPKPPPPPPLFLAINQYQHIFVYFSCYSNVTSTAKPVLYDLPRGQ